uniref:gamma-glutamyl hydrolase n=1 Tax=Scatophagus argus TaxID=75038 RepID=UPI001ED7D5C5|nr:gamma-glutamyl hydrolase [Scatophagus argus]
MAITGFSAYVCLLIAGCFCCSKAMPTKLKQEAVNDRPVIGVLTQIVSDEVLKPFGRTFIPASYVKYMESGGSRVMPIRLTLSAAEYETIFRQINGLLLIGGAADLETSDFARVAKIFYTLARAANDAGDFFPIWGTCMGMQLLTVLVAGENLLTNTTAENIAMPLNLTTEATSSRMFEGFPSELMMALSQEPLTGNFHHYGLTVKTFQENEMLQNFFSILSTNIAENGAHFVSTIEGKRYPFYGTQWHPEVNRFQWNRKLNFPHSRHAIQLSSLLAEFFSNEGRRSLHHFDNPEEEDSSLIYSYTPVYAANFTGYEQLYFF